MPAGLEPRRILLGLVGAGLSPSRSPAMHEREADHHGLRCLYQRIDLDASGLTVADLPRILDAVELAGFRGVNVTHPCKQAVLPFLSRVSDDAQALHAVNTVVFHNGARMGHNTDWSAFRRAFGEGLPGADISRVAQLGAGGAGAATAYALLTMGAASVSIFDVDAGKASELARRLGAAFPGRCQAVGDLRSALAGATGLVHATPTGMAAHPGLPLHPEGLRPDLWVAEVVYFPLETELLRHARARGCRTLDGRGMAVFQAVEAFRHFTGLEAEPERMRTTFEAFDA